MLPIKWPPEFDGIKIDGCSILGRVENTEIWIEFDLTDTAWLSYLLSPQMYGIIAAWNRARNHS
jgi:hypothetical protein